jgi:hypothetical protein
MTESADRAIVCDFETAALHLLSVVPFECRLNQKAENECWKWF